jgi:hypothetical protein
MLQIAPREKQKRKAKGKVKVALKQLQFLERIVGIPYGEYNEVSKDDFCFMKFADDKFVLATGEYLPD